MLGYMYTGIAVKKSDMVLSPVRFYSTEDE